MANRIRSPRVALPSVPKLSLPNPSKPPAVKLPVLPPPRDIEAPRKRAQCQHVTITNAKPPPCPWVSCRYHLLVEVFSNGKLGKNQKFSEYDEDSIVSALCSMEYTCALDAADTGPASLKAISKLTGVTVEGARKIEERALRKVRDLGMDMEDPGDGSRYPWDEIAPHLEPGDMAFISRWVKRKGEAGR